MKENFCMQKQLTPCSDVINIVSGTADDTAARCYSILYEAFCEFQVMTSHLNKL